MTETSFLAAAEGVATTPPTTLATELVMAESDTDTLALVSDTDTPTQHRLKRSETVVLAGLPLVSLAALAHLTLALAAAAAAAETVLAQLGVQEALAQSQVEAEVEAAPPVLRHLAKAVTVAQAA